MRDYVMAILCSPVSASELQTTEKNHSVFIIRKMDFSDNTSGYIRHQQYLERIDAFPFKLMFVFGSDDVIVVRNTRDRKAVQEKLGCVI